MTVKSFSQLRKKSSNFNKLQEKMEQASGKKKDYSDDRFWRAQQDKAGNAQAVIRFLDAPKEEDAPFVKLFKYGFKGPTGQWLIENCPTTIGGESPILEANNILWDSKTEENEKLARDRKRKLSYTSNIYVVSDPANPENEGKVFLFQYGQKIFEKIQNAIAPEFDDAPCDIFNMWEGANFKLRIVKKAGYANYDNSAFEAPAPLFADEESSEYETVWNAQHSLQEFLDPKHFKSYDELNARFQKVIGAKAPSAGHSATVEDRIAKVSEADSLPSVSEADLDAELESMNTNDNDDLDDDLDAFKALVD